MIKRSKSKIILSLDEAEWEMLRELDSENMKLVLFSLIDYSKWGKAKELNEKVRALFSFLKRHSILEYERRKSISEKRSIAGKKGAEVKKRLRAEREKTNS